LPDEIELLLANDIADCVVDLSSYTFWPELSAIRKAALIDLRFCVGSAGFRAFKRMRAALEAKDYPLAAQELRNSKFALQTGRRAEELANMLTYDAIP
jgi:lysozyme